MPSVPASTDTAAVLLGHGSRDPIWCQPMQAMAAAIAQTGIPVTCAYLELCPPPAQQAIETLLASHAGIQRIIVYPVFLGIGLHLRDDLPELAKQLQDHFPQLHIHFTPALGLDPQLIELVAHRVIDACEQAHSIQPPATP